ncbi:MULTISPECIES: recombinase family protein [Clostridia]|jgi:site-specific DNA recombinase|uniref:recombinase family protein n=1 Tax=Clostridia TaxID=186801 RepID=UPI001D01671F|nr:recombinase family protein [Ruminococcus callidus]MCB5774983.1 recombinase family protein [Ruminococcus callidus]MCC2758969.1 recombinase family protein [Ruminococcus callidus]
MQTGKITALYARFSFDDGIDTESGSIEHQKALLKNYAESNGFTNLSYYADDGYTGTNFNRPDFQRMMDDIKNGFVETVIVKDMSRLGRNYLMVGQYVEIDFPKYHVRFIAISDNVDSAKGMNELLPINNLMNEWYSRDISKKIRSMMRQKGNSGQHITSKLPYGYYNTLENKQEWLIDKEAAEVVREIFELYVYHAMGTKQIAMQLQAEKRVGVEYHKKIRKGIAVTAENIYSWCSATVVSILKRQEYVGDTVNFRTERTSYKNKTVIYNGSDKIKIFPNTHPAIISRELFQMAQNKREKTIRHPSRPHKYLFGDYLYCMDCHARMHGRQCGTKRENALYCYECATYRKSKGCYFHGVPEKYLEDEVLKAIQRIISKAKSDPDEFHRIMQNHLEKKSDDSRAVVSADLEKAQLRIAEIDKYIQGLFEAKVRGEIDGALFASLKKTYDEEKEQLNALVAELIGKLHEKNESANKVKLLMQAIKKYDAVTELTPQILADFIEHIEVGKCQNTSKKLPFSKRDNAISVFFRGIGIF